MANLSLVIVPAKVLIGGKHKIRIALSHNSETRYIITDVVINSDKEFRNGAIVKRDDASYLNSKLRMLMNKYQRSIDEIASIECMTCAQIIRCIQTSKVGDKKTISDIFSEYINTADVKSGTVKTYTSCYRTLELFLGPKMLITNITHQTILNYDKWLRNNHLKGDSIRGKMVVLNIIIKYAQRCKYLKSNDNPFAGYRLPDKTIRQAWITKEDIKIIRDLEIKKKNLSKCRDLFMLSYYMGGTNLLDLLNINFNEQMPYLRYERSKTDRQSKINKYVEFSIPQEAIEIINKYKGENGLLKVTASQRKTVLHHMLAKNMPRLANMAGLKSLIFYSARKTFSQQAFILGINTSVIDYILGHKIGNASSSLYNYIKVTPEMATEAIRKVLDNLK
ncbi:phage integrase SAM-like domain-containing protein [Bacteroides sp.]|uniref:tyrosine-type recombinase/integrase n=1 Tax=Bacteroides sp. TaxID=29523 RepID=UPI002630DB77|nr:phage integrase SAM-like domain-containing protein [Bacteroides sp.]